LIILHKIISLCFSFVNIFDIRGIFTLVFPVVRLFIFSLVLELLNTTNDGRYVSANAKLNDGCLSDEGQNVLTKLLINHLFQDQHKYLSQIY